MSRCRRGGLFLMALLGIAAATAPQLEAQRIYIGEKYGSAVLPVIDAATGEVAAIPVGIFPPKLLDRSNEFGWTRSGKLCIIDPATRVVVATINLRRISSGQAETRAPDSRAARRRPARLVIPAPDDLGILDTATGFEWLPFSYTEGLTFEQAVVNPSPAIPAGFDLATDAEVSRLLRDLGFPPARLDSITDIRDNGALADGFFALFATSDAINRSRAGISKPDVTIFPCDAHCMASSLSATVVYGSSAKTSRSGSALLHLADYLGIDPSIPAPCPYFLVRRRPPTPVTAVRRPASAQHAGLARPAAEAKIPSAPGGALSEIAAMIEKLGLPRNAGAELMTAIKEAVNSAPGDGKSAAEILSALERRLESLGSEGKLLKEQSDLISRIAARLHELIR